MPVSPQLRSHQVDAIRAVERAILAGRRDIVVRMATGTGKTTTALTEINRLVASGVATRVLYLVDRTSSTQQLLEAVKNLLVSSEHTFTDVCRVYEEGEGLVRLLREEAVASADSVGEVGHYIYISTVQDLHRQILQMTSESMSFEGALTVLPSELFDLMVNDTLDDPFVVYEEDIRDVVARYFEPIILSFISGAVSPNVPGNGIVFQYTLEQAIADGVLVNPGVARARPMVTDVADRTHLNRRIFLFYVDEDRVEAARIADELRAARFDVVPDVIKRLDASDLATNILHEIRSGEALVFLLSPNTIDSPWLNAGFYQIVAQRGAEFVPAMIKPCMIPRALADRAVVDATEGAAELMRSLVWTEAIDFTSLGSQQFTDLTADLLKRIGFSLEEPSGPDDIGADFRAVYRDQFGFADPTHYVVQVKYGVRARPSVRDLWRLADAVRISESLHALVVTNVQLTSLAQGSLADLRHERSDLRVLDGPRIKDLLIDYPDLVLKYFGSGEVADDHA